MADREFQLRLHARYAQPDNAVAELRVEQRVTGQWQPFQVHNLTPGFDIYVYAMLVCQHTYFRLNCAERGLQLVQADGEILLVADQDWQLQRQHVHFEAQLVAGEAQEADIACISERMQQCPVSKNTRAVADSRVVLQFA